MKIAVIGAGVVGTTTAYELAQDGHVVTVFESRASIAEGASFANGCQLAPSLTQSLSHPQWPNGALTALRRLFQTARLKRNASVRDLQWLLQWSRSRSPEEFLAGLRANHALLAASLDRLQAIVQNTSLIFDRSAGQMLLFSREIDAEASAAKLNQLKDLGVALKVLLPEEARALEPGMNASTSLHSAVYFPNDEVGNCRQFAQLIKDEAQSLGVEFCLGTTVSAIHAHSKPTLAFADQSADAAFDRVIVCTGDDPSGFIAAAQIRGRCALVHSYSVSLPIREQLNAPRSALFDAEHRVSITRNGGRIRVSGGFELGDAKGKYHEKTIRLLYNSVQNHFPGAANFQQSGQTWKGSSLFSSDALPLIGPTPMAGVYLNVGHGNNGWGMACGAARLVSDLIAEKATAVDANPFCPLRFRT